MSLFSQVAPSIAETLKGVVEEKAPTEVSQEKGVMSTDTPPKEEESFAVKYAMDIVGREPRVLEPVPKKSKTYKVELPEVDPLEVQAYLDAIEVEQGPITPPTTMGEMAGASASDVAAERNEAGITQSRTESANVYKIKKGDNLSKIARANNTTVAAILELNDIDNPDIIVEGDRLVMPDPVSPTANLETAGVMSRPEPVVEESVEEVPTPTATLSEEEVASEVAALNTEDYNMFSISNGEVSYDMEEVKRFARNTFNNPVKAAAFIATVEAESGTGLEESANYGFEGAIDKANQGKYGAERKRLVEKLYADPKKTFTDSKGVLRLKEAHRPELFNIIYNDKYRTSSYKLGNTQEGDGWRYRGRGLIQITGRKNYLEIGKMIGVDLVSNPDILLTDPDVMLRATLAFMTRAGYTTKNITQDSLASIIGHGDDKKNTKRRRRWNRAAEIYEEMYGESMPTNSNTATELPETTAAPMLRPTE